MRLPTIHQGVNRRNVEYFAENRGCYAFQENFGRTFEHPNLIHASYSLLVDFTSSEENSFKKKLAKFQIWSVPQWATSCSNLNQDEIWRLNPPLTLSLQWNPAQVSILEVLGGDTASHISKDFKTLFKKKIINLNEPEASLSSLCTPQTAVVWCHYVWTLKFSCCLICSSLSLWRMYSKPQNTLQVDLCRWVRLQTLLVPIGIVAPGMLEIC